MKRRTFIIFTTMGLAAFSIPIAHYYFVDIEYDSKLTHPQLLSMIWDKKMIKTVGEKYRKLMPGENNERALVKLLLKKVSTNKDALTLALEKKIRNDFETKNIVTVDGWILSITEARQCALFSTIQFK